MKYRESAPKRIVSVALTVAMVVSGVSAQAIEEVTLGDGSAEVSTSQDVTEDGSLVTGTDSAGIEVVEDDPTEEASQEGASETAEAEPEVTDPPVEDVAPEEEGTGDDAVIAEDVAGIATQDDDTAIEEANETKGKDAKSAAATTSGSALSAQATTSADKEPNDDYSTAGTIALNKTYSGNSYYDGDVDWYKLTLPSAGRLEVTFNAEYRSVQDGWDIRLYDSKKSELWYNEFWTGNNHWIGGTAGDCRMRATGLPKGTYYIRVNSDPYDWTDVTYRFTAKFTKSSVRETEFNDDLSTADPIKLNTIYHGNSKHDGDVDWYKLTLPSAGKLEVTFNAEYRSAQDGWDIRLYDSAKNELWYNEFWTGNNHWIGGTAGDCRMRATGLPKGTYYIRVNSDPYDWTDVEYRFTAKFTKSSVRETEFNDDLSTADPIKLNTTYSGNSKHDGDVDWYRLTLPSAGRLEVTFNAEYRSAQDGWDIRLYDSAKNELWYNEFWTGNDHWIGGTAGDYSLRTTELTKGTYYIRVNSDPYDWTDIEYHLTAWIDVPVSTLTIAKVPNQAYTGKAIKPSPKVTYNGTTLKRGTDYALSYKNNVNAGTATITVKGKGHYTGSKSITFKIVKPSVQYYVHRQTYGWEDAWSKSDGAQSGTTGESKRLEGIRIKLATKPVSGSIAYRTHIQTYGWESGWKRDGAMSGTTGESKRLEAIQIKLTGDMVDKYDVWYRVHAQHFGWMGWAKNGQSAGTAGYSYRLEAIQVVLRPKGSSAPAETFKGATQMTSARFKDANA